MFLYITSTNSVKTEHANNNNQSLKVHSQLYKERCWYVFCTLNGSFN
jgi:hypothetical protein